jgi:hypothetical protein
VLEGEGLMEIAGKNHVVRKHDFVFLRPGRSTRSPIQAWSIWYFWWSLRRSPTTKRWSEPDDILNHTRAKPNAGLRAHCATE